MSENNTNQVNYQNISVSEGENASVQIEGELTADKLNDARTRALEKMRENVEVDGFRKGSAPDDVLINKYGEMTILQEAAEIALTEEYPAILQDQQINAIGQPQVSITKLSPNEPLGFKIETATMPQFELPDWRTLATEELAKEENQIQEPEVTNEEVEDVILQVRRNAAQQQQQANGEIGGTDPSQMSEDQLPEIDDAFVQMMGFDGVEQFRKQIRDNIRQEKMQKEQEKQRTAVIDRIINETELTLPDVIVDNEVERMMAQLKQDIENAGYTYENYLEQVGKSEDDIKQEWRPQAEKRAKTQLILNKIAAQEEVTPDTDEVNQQLEQIMQQHPDADREKARTFVETQLMNQKVLELFDEQAPEPQQTSSSTGESGDEDQQQNASSEENATDKTEKSSETEGEQSDTSNESEKKRS